MSSNNKPTLRDLPRGEMERIRGGQSLPPLRAIQFETPTWKYVDFTPSWAIANAIDMGFEVENLTD